MTTTSAVRPAPTTPQNGFGTAGLVLGIIALLICLIPLIGLLGTPLALVGLGLSIVGVVKARSAVANNFNSALAGLILSVVALAAAFLWMIVAAVAAADTDSFSKGESKTSAPVVAAAADAQPAAKAPAAKKGAKPAAGANTAKKANLTSKIGSEHVVRLGTAINIEGFLGVSSANVTVDKFVNKTKAESEFYTPEAGNKFVAAHVVIENTGDEDYSNVSWVGTKIYTASGQGYNSDVMFGPTVGRALPSSVDLKPGGRVDGWLMFEVPADEKLDSIAFDDAEWKL